MKSDAARLRGIREFLKAGLAVSAIQVNEADAEFEQTQHSCYSEGWARGFQQAMRMTDDFVTEALEGDNG